MRQTTDYGRDHGFFSEVLSIWFGGLVGRWVGGSMDRWVGNKKSKERNPSEGWWVSGLVGRWVGWWDAQKELVLGTYMIVFPPKPIVVF